MNNHPFPECTISKEVGPYCSCIIMFMSHERQTRTTYANAVFLECFLGGYTLACRHKEGQGCLQEQDRGLLHAGVAIPQLVGVFTKIFNQSLSGVAVPHCLKSSTIFPLLKKKNVVLKCLENRFRIHFTTYLPLWFDPHQFIYKANRSMEDTFHSALFHLVHQGDYARLLFVDFRSTFNTILLNRPVTKVSDLGVPYSICCCDVQGTTWPWTQQRLRTWSMT